MIWVTVRRLPATASAIHITETPEQGRELALAMARKAIGAIQPDASVRQVLRAGYATNADSLVAAGHVVAIEFATIAAANNYWRDN